MTASERLTVLSEGTDPMLIMRMKSGFAVIGQTQFLAGYSLLLAYPEVASLNDMSYDARSHFLSDMAVLGDAVQQATDCKRINYSIYGNLDPFLHAHIFPRYDDEHPDYKTLPPLSYPEEIREAWQHRYDPERHIHLKDDIRLMLTQILHNTHS